MQEHEGSGPAASDSLWYDDSDLLLVVEAIAGWVDRTERDACQPVDAVEAIDATPLDYLAIAMLVPCADLCFAIEWAMTAVEQIEATRRLELGRAADLFRAHLEEFVADSAAISELHFRLADLESRAAAGDCATAGEAVAWFADDRRMPPGVAVRLVGVLHRCAATGALVELLLPWGAARSCGVRRVALDAVAHLAAAPSSDGRVARGALLDLAEHPELAGAVAVRLPAHLLDIPQRARLREVVKDWDQFASTHRAWITPDSVARASLSLRDALLRTMDVRTFDLE